MKECRRRNNTDHTETNSSRIARKKTRQAVLPCRGRAGSLTIRGPRIKNGGRHENRASDAFEKEPLKVCDTCYRYESREKSTSERQGKNSMKTGTPAGRPRDGRRVTGGEAEGIVRICGEEGGAYLRIRTQVG